MDVCDGCQIHCKVRYKGAKRPTAPYFCRKCVVNRPEVKSKLSSNAKAQWATPEFAAIVRQSSKEIWNDPERRHKMSQIRRDPANTARLRLNNQQMLQTRLYAMLDTMAVTYFKEHSDGNHDEQCIIGPYTFDCAITKDDKTILIECQGDYWHSIPTNVRRDLAKRTYVSEYLSGSHELKFLWEHEFSNPQRIEWLLRYWLGQTAPSIHYTFDSIVLQQITDNSHHDFLDKFHCQGSNRRGGIVFGAFLGKECIAIAQFSPPVRQNVAQGYIDFSRFCIHPSYRKRNLGSWMIRRCLDRLRSMNVAKLGVVTYADTTYNHTGALYAASGFKRDGEVPSDYWYASNNRWIMRKKTLYNRAKAAGLTERQYAIANGYTKVYGFPKIRFIKDW